jgi:hypothetical protein
VSDEGLLDWWTGEAPPEDRLRLEEHLLSCDACSARAEALHALAHGLRTLVREGLASAVLLPATVDRLRAEGRRVREYRVAPGTSVRCTVGPGDDVVLGRLEADLGGVSRLDLVSRVDDGPELRLADVPFDPASGELILTSPIDALRARPAHVQRMRLLAVGPGGERVLGEYTFDHTPWPDPPRGATRRSP